MSTTTHLWAIGYDDMARADQVRDEIIELGWGDHSQLHKRLLCLSVIPAVD
jgi:hypothetical protein